MPNGIRIEHCSGQHPICIQVKLDMEQYCNVVFEFDGLTQQLERLSLVKSNLPKDSQEGEQIERELLELAGRQSDVKIKMGNEKKELSRLVSGLEGAEQWGRVMTLFKTAMASGDAAEKTFSDQLEKTQKPLVFDCLQLSFIELVKNSMDAVINSNRSSRRSMNLEMMVSIELLTGSRVAVTVKDNGGGFPEDYIGGFVSYINNKKYLEESYLSRKNNPLFNFYFGGAGRGLTILYALLLDGLALERTQNPRRCYERRICSHSSVTIENRDEGAVIQLISNSDPAENVHSPIGSQGDLSTDFPGFSSLTAATASLAESQLSPSNRVQRLSLFARRLSSGFSRGLPREAGLEALPDQPPSKTANMLLPSA